MARENSRNREQRRLAQAIERNLQITTTARLTVQETSGPLPNPDILKRYDELVPGAADRIIRLAETEATHRRSLEDKIVTAQVRDVHDDRIEGRIGQITAGVITVVVVTCGTYAIVHGYPLTGGALSGGTIISLVGIFIWGRTRKPAPEKPPEKSEQSIA